MSFNIGSQTGGVINNVTGTQHISGGQQGQAVSDAAARSALVDLQAAVQEVSLPSGPVGTATAQLDEIKATLDSPKPDRSKVGAALEKLAALLIPLGAVTTSGAALIGPIQTLANWVGTWGPSVASLLPPLL